MSDLRNHLQSAKQSHRATKYPGDLALDVLAPNRRSFKPLWLLAPIAAAAIVAIVVMTQQPPPSVPILDPLDGDQTPIATVDGSSDDSLFALVDVPNMHTDMGIAPAADESTLPTFTDISVPEMPSFDSTTTESST